MKLSRKQIQDSIASSFVAPEPMRIGQRQLTAKQKKFCANVVDGKNATDSYKDAYNPPNATNQSIGNGAYKLKQDSRIVAEINALTLAKAASQYRSIEGVRAIAVQSLVEAMVDPKIKASERIQAARVVLTSLIPPTAVAAAIGSGALKDKILAELKLMMNKDAQTIDSIAEDDSLMAELMETGQNDAPDDSDEGTPPPPDQADEMPDAGSLHIIPPIQSEISPDLQDPDLPIDSELPQE
jgi:uncharacterized coiled-coil protein SlyX